MVTSTTAMAQLLVPMAPIMLETRQVIIKQYMVLMLWLVAVQAMITLRVVTIPVIKCLVLAVNMIMQQVVTIPVIKCLVLAVNMIMQQVVHQHMTMVHMITSTIFQTLTVKGNNNAI